MMMDDQSSNTGGKTVKIDLVLEKEVYKSIERISTKLGIDPSSWINFVLRSKVNGIRGSKTGDGS